MNKIIELIKKIVEKVGMRTVIEVLVAAALLIFGSIAYSRYKTAEENFRNARNNEKAYQEQLEGNRSDIIEYKRTIEELEYQKDSVSVKLMQVRRELGIKDRELREANYMLSVFKGRVDTLYMTDTIFRDPSFAIDTCLGDKWVKTHLTMAYPSYVSVEPEVTSEKMVYVYDKKETVDPPRKFFLFRWFQKKHTLIRVEVHEENPYIVSQQNVFNQIID